MGKQLSPQGLQRAAQILLFLCFVAPVLINLHTHRKSQLERDAEEALRSLGARAPPFPSNVSYNNAAFRKFEADAWHSHGLIRGEDARYIEERSSIKEGFMLSYMHKRVPYIVRNARELHHITQGLLVSALLRNTSMTLNGYIEMNDVKYPVTEMLARWHAGQDVLVIDAPVPNFVKLPKILSEFNSFSAQTQTKGQAAKTETSVQLSARGHYTALHADPLETGGSWVYAAEGEKHWIFFPPAYLMDVATYFDFLEKANFTGLQSFVRHRKKGPLYMAVLGPGDFISWPPGWTHKVYTSKRFIGLGSYMLTDRDKEDMDIYGVAIKAVRGEIDVPSLGDPFAGPGRSESP